MAIDEQVSNAVDAEEAWQEAYSLIRDLPSVGVELRKAQILALLSISSAILATIPDLDGDDIEELKAIRRGDT